MERARLSNGARMPQRPAKCIDRLRQTDHRTPRSPSHRRTLGRAEAFEPPVPVGLAAHDLACAAVRAESGGVAVAIGDRPQAGARRAAHDRHFFALCPCPPLRDRHPAPRPLLALWSAVPDLFLLEPLEFGGVLLVVAVDAAQAVLRRSPTFPPFVPERPPALVFKVVAKWLPRWCLVIEALHRIDKPDSASRHSVAVTVGSVLSGPCR